MVMALVWKDATAFKRHLEHMSLFRQAHRREASPAPLQSLPQVACLRPQHQPGGVNVSVNTRGRTATAPLGPVALPANTQN